MDRHKLLNRLVWFMVVVLLITSAITIYLLIDQRNAFGKIVDSSVQYHIDNLDLKDGYTPVKGVDYVDGKDATSKQVSESVRQWFQANPVNDGVDGRDGIDGIDGNNGKDAPIITNEQIDASVKRYLEENPPQIGLTPIIRCNDAKNRWEVKYNQEDSWQLLGGTRIVCTVETPE